jgi:hypothetical protein
MAQIMSAIAGRISTALEDEDHRCDHVQKTWLEVLTASRVPGPKTSGITR